ncbi:LysR family transcriptional regulator [Brevibacillus daliensis]|uniref:LysR family transcriptional regulator n=1 Tax=Brevibacillus daliensis TaxID=2892995 RepID=UPI001E58FF9F|nr:LysR family transcriptional regulator [Brevibacillus daliensis]
MDEKDWLLLRILYEEKNITKAAQQLFMSQPAITYRLQQIEKDFNTQLVSRTKKGVEFTAQGERLVQYSTEMLLQLRKLKEEIINMDGQVRGMLRLGVSGNFARYQFPPLLKQFLVLYPDVEINLLTGWSTEIMQYIHREEIHIGIVRGDHHWLEGKHLLAEEPMCIVSKNEIDIDNLPALPRINYKTDPSLKNTISAWWQEKYDAPPLVTMEVDRIETCKEMVRTELGYAIFPLACLTESDQLHYSLLRTSNNEVIKRKTWVIYRKSSMELSIIRAFIEFITSMNVSVLVPSSVK